MIWNRRVSQFRSSGIYISGEHEHDEHDDDDEHDEKGHLYKAKPTASALMEQDTFTA